ncbi:MAG: hypothetical protein M3Y49_02130 [Actinomycetota bacterium]|nr:hypothetical protein [Actinomycetota bacterium]
MNCPTHHGSDNDHNEGADRKGSKGPSRHRGPRSSQGFAGPGRGRPGGWQQADLPPADDAAGWFAGRLPSGLYTGSPTVTVDREEIVVIGDIAAPDLPDDADPTATEAAVEGRLTRFREETRDIRMALAQEAQAKYKRSVAWGARIGATQVVFTNLAVPVMTRLRQDERRVLDTLVDAGVARSRADAVSWSVKLVGEHTQEWLAELREAMTSVDDLRAKGPRI